MEDEVYIHKEWLDTQTPQVCVSIAYRAAMRVLPLALEVSRTDASERLALETLRKAQIAGVGAERPTPEIIAAASSVPIFESIAESIANAAMRAVSLAADTVERFDDADAVSQYAAYTTDGAGSAARRAVGNSDHAAAAVLACTTADIESLAEHGSLDGIAIVRPDDLEAAIPQYLAGGRSALNEGGPWTFWAEWYDRAMAGDPLNWDLQEKIARIPNDIWEAGPVAVAAEIARIKTEFDLRASPRPDTVPKIEKKILNELVKALLSTPNVTSEFALSSAETLDRAIQEYLNETGENCLPEEFAAMEALPAHFRRIAGLVEGSSEDSDAVAELEVEIEALNGRVAQLEGELKAALEKTLNGRFKVAAIEGLAKTVTSPWAIGALGYGACHFFGWTPNVITFANLRAYGEALYKASPLIER